VEFETELARVGIERLRPRFYLSSEWGVPFESISIAIPYYLARPDLTTSYAERIGYVEGSSRDDILRYLRHEMGHTVNYGYRLYAQEEWTRHFGSMAQPYKEEYRAEPFSQRYVRHLPGWYAQKHPDEDWAETFAVWMTPGLGWRAEYRDWPVALAKLEYCERTMRQIKDQEPLVRTIKLDEDVKDLAFSIEDLSKMPAMTAPLQLPLLDGDLRTIFPDARQLHADGPDREAASALIRRFERELMASTYRWTGHFPERTRQLLRQLAMRADQLGAAYNKTSEPAVIVGLTALVTTLATNFVRHGSYIPDVEAR
jgi:hypothetical protein